MERFPGKVDRRLLVNLDLCPGRIKVAVARGGGASLRKWVSTYSAVTGTESSGETPGETE
jgi:hypothetical protein